jgi:hypothetical protein
MNSQSKGSAPRKSHAALWTILILVVLGVVAVFVVHTLGQWRLNQAQDEADRILTARTELLVQSRAVAMARTAAVLSRQALELGQTEFLQESLDDLVRQPGIVSIAVFDPGLIAVVATDRKVLGAVVSTPEATRASTAQMPTIMEGTIYVPIMAATKRLGTLRLTYDPVATELLGSGREETGEGG